MDGPDMLFSAVADNIGWGGRMLGNVGACSSCWDWREPMVVGSPSRPNCVQVRSPIAGGGGDGA